MKKNSRRIYSALLIALLLVSFFALTSYGAGETGVIETGVAETTDAAGEGEKVIRILATSDMHGYFTQYDYFADTEVSTGAGANVVSAIAALRNENTIVVDAGDLIQDNLADIFLEDDIHPMASVLNTANYDCWVTGNHEYNFGMDALLKFRESVNAELLLGNVYKNGERIGKNYIILERGGVKIALIGVVTPNIAVWDSANLQGWDVENPIDTVKEAIKEIGDSADLLVGVFHMGLNDEFGVVGSGANSIAEACGELDFIISAHDHQAFDSLTENGIPVVANKNHGETLVLSDLTVAKGTDGKYFLKEINSEIINTADYEASPELLEATMDQHLKAKAEAGKVIGTVKSQLIDTDAATGLCTVCLEDSCWMQIIHDCMRYYSGADVVVASPTLGDKTLEAGDITNADICKIYYYNNNTLYKLQMTGKQLKTYMEYAAGFYNRFNEGDLTVSYNENWRFYNFDAFDGINYEIDISKPVGERIINLTRSDGNPVRDDDILTVAVSDYRAKSHLLQAGIIFEENDLPTLLETDIAGYIGGFQQLISTYIRDVLCGEVEPYCDNNWTLAGIDRDEELYQTALELIESGQLEIVNAENGRQANIVSITEQQVKVCLYDSTF